MRSSGFLDDVLKVIQLSLLFTGFLAFSVLLFYWGLSDESVVTKILDLPVLQGAQK